MSAVMRRTVYALLALPSSRPADYHSLTMPERALAGVTVIEVGKTGAAAYAAKLMADLGADVIKVEPPEGDPARALGPFPGHKPNPDASGTYLYLNTNKHGVTLNLPSAAGRTAFDKLIATADVLVHDFTPKEAKGLGVVYDRVRSLNGNLVMTSIFPFGGDGPLRDYRAEELTLLSAGGWAWLNGWPGMPEQPPLKPWGFQTAYQGGVNAALATMGALFARQRGLAGGQHVEVSVQECIASILEMTLPSWSYAQVMAVRYGNRPIQPIEMMQCKDGAWVFALTIEEHQWQRLVELMDTPEWTTWEVAANRFVRASNWDALRPFFQEFVSKWNAHDLYEAAQARRIPFAPVSTLTDLVSSEHLKVRGFFVEVGHSEAGKLRHAGAPYQLGGTPWEIRSPAPTLGQHNEKILGEKLGLAEDQIAAAVKGDA
jgi:crotonobetainyl-CoA:carnitine CoA-transferase CaiB-like acyl-CoA transferase